MNEIEGTIPAEEVVEAEVYLVETPSQSGAEVIDAREGHDGSIFDNLGQAIRTQISDLWDNKAPAGHGLGGSGAYVDNLDTLKTTGVYTFTHGATGNPFSGWGGIVRVGVAKTGIEQVVTCNTKNGVSARRLMYTDSNKTTFEPWEWVNPPMVAGVEYRTTERCNGNPVYTARIYYGKGSSTGSVDIYTNSVTGLNVKFIDAVCKAEQPNGWSEFIVNPNLTFAESGSGSAMFAVRNKGDLSNHDIYLTVKYYKV